MSLTINRNKARLLCGLLAVLMMLTLIPTTQVFAADQVYTQKGDTYIGTFVEATDSGTVEREFKESELLADGEEAFCVEIAKDFEAGYKTKYDATVWLTEDQIADIALNLEYVRNVADLSSIDAHHQYLLQQSIVWRRLSEFLGWGMGQTHIAYDEVSKDVQDSIYAAAQQFADENKDRYECSGVLYIGEGQSLGQFWATLAVGSATLTKSSSNTSVVSGNDLYSLAGAEYTVYADADCSTAATDTSGNSVKFKTDADGSCETVEMFKGTYYVKETKAAKGYALDESVYSVTVKTGETATVSVKDVPLVDQTGIAIYKIDAETGEPVAQGDASLENAQFTVKYYAGDYSESEVKDMDPTRTWVIQTKEVDGQYVARLADNYKVSGDDWYTQDSAVVLPLGTYTIQETSAPTGYLVEGEFLNEDSKVAVAGEVFYTQLLENGGATWTVGGNTYTQDELVIRGGVEIRKRDVQSQRDAAQSNASLEGAVFEIVNQSEAAVLVNGESYEPGEVVLTLTTDEEGYASTDADTLPFGSYTITETEAPSGYLLGNGTHDDATAQSITSIDFKIEEEGVIIDLTDPYESISDLVKRGDLSFEKQNGMTQSTMGTIKFKITSETTGESHIFWTDVNGQYSTSSSWEPHSQNTNAGETYEDGIWFYGYEDETNSGVEVDDSLGALPYDTYLIEEQACANNKGMELVTTEVTIYRDDNTVHIGTIDDYEQDVELGTTLINDWTGEHQATIFENHDISLTDTIEYYGLRAGETYTVKGVLMDKETGEPLLDPNGEEIWAETTFTAEDTEGSVEVTFEFDANGLHGTETVAFEYLYDSDGDLVVSHEDIDDVDQTVELLLPTLWTYAAETLSGRKAIEAKDDVSITDMLYLSGLIPGHTYYVYGKAVDPETGELILDHDGNPLEMTVEFVADAEEMTLDIMEFHFNASDLAGKSVVFEEYLYADADRTILITEEEDLGSPEQTVYFFGDILLGTTLVDDETESHAALADDHVTLIDTVEYEGATVGETYTVTGTLMDQATGLAVKDKDGNEVTAQSDPFMAEEETGVVEVTFEFDASDLDGDSVVAYEFMYNSEGTLVGAHEDINDEGQTVDFPEIATTLLDDETETHYAVADDSVTLIDTVVYENLIPGETYHVIGILMNKETGEEFKDAAGNAVTSEAEFTAEEAEGIAEVTFTFDGSGMEGISTVAFEYLYDVNGKLIATHEDLDDDAQTVKLDTEEAVTEAENETTEDTPATYSMNNGSGSSGSTPKTGDTANVAGWIALGLGGLAAAASAIIRLRRRKKLGTK